MSQKEQIKAILEEMINHKIKGQQFLSGKMIVLLQIALSRIEKEVPDNEWISVKDRLPEKDGTYLVYGDDEDGEIYDYFIHGRWNNMNPTHWMHLPNPPTINQ